MCSLFLSLKARTTCSKKLRDLLMAWASVSLMPVLSDFLVLSHPAKSTKWSFEKETLSDDSTLERLSTWMVKIVWALDEAALRAVAPVVRSSSPSNRQLRASSSRSQTCWERPRTTQPPLWSSEIYRLLLVEPPYAESKSLICSL